MKLFKIIVALGLVTLLGGCGGSGDGSPSSTSSGGVGSVAVLMTDAPIDGFDQFWLTVTEIALLGDDSKVLLFSGSERFNLLDLNSHSNLFSLTENIPVGFYSKIRMRVSDPELVRLNADGTVAETVVPLMSGNGKLDLNPRGGLHVLSGETLALQIDLDAKKSIHLIQQGNGEYRFRPVVFVDVLTDGISGKLLRVAGVIGDIGTNSFELCKTGMAVEDHHAHSEENSHDESHANEHDDDEHHGDHDDDEHDNDHHRCIQVASDSETSFFNSDGVPVQSVTLTKGEPATVLGYYRKLGDHKIGLDAEVVELAAAAVYQQIAGTVESMDLDNNSFTLRNSDNTLLTVEFADESKFFAMSGKLLSVDQLDVGDAVKVEGVLFAADDLIKAAAIFIDLELASVEQLSGTVSLLHDDLLGFDVIDATLGDVCVRVNGDTHFYLLTLDGGSFVSEEVGFAELQLSQRVDVYGAFNLTGCFVAENVLAEAL